MKTLSAFACILLLQLAAALPASSQWKEANGPYGAEVKTLLRVDSTIFAGSNSLYRSDDYGETWKFVLNGFPRTTNVRDLKRMGDVLFAASERDGVYHSTDGGNSWTFDMAGMGVYLAYDLACTSSKVYALTQPLGLLVSSDTGRTWSSVGSANVAVYDVEATDSLLILGSVGCLVSTDGGATWVDRSATREPNQEVTTTLFYGGKLFAGTPSGVYASSDTGRSWTWVRMGLPGTEVHSFAAAREKFYVCMDGGLFCSADSGKSWSTVHTGITDTLVYTLESKGDTLLIGGYTGIYRSLDGGATWLPAHTGLRGYHVDCFAGSDTSLYCVTSVGLFHSSDNGVNWSRRVWNIGDLYGMTFWRGSIIASSQKGLFRSDDNGSSWFRYSPPLEPWWEPVNRFAQRDSLLCAGGIESYFLYRLTWGDTAVQVCPPGFSYPFDIRYLDSTLYAASNYGVSSWQPQDTAWTLLNYDLGVARGLALTNVGERLFVGTTQGVYLSTDRGVHWVASSSIPRTYVYSLVAADGMLFAGCSKNGVYLSRDNGDHWLPASEGITSGLYAYDLYVAGDNLLLESDKGVWVRSLSDTTFAGVKEEQALAAEYRLFQNYPNPFNPVTTIGYTVGGIGDRGPGIRNVKLSIYNLLGQEVAVLVNEQQLPGRYTVTFDGSRLASGVYLYRLSAGGYGETKKLLLLK